MAASVWLYAVSTWPDARDVVTIARGLVVPGLHRVVMPDTSNRPPVTVLPKSEAVDVTESRSASRRALPSRPPIDAHSAAAPLTCGVSIEVPL